jgi:enoyl-CoA hydratase/carnithine racemase
MPGQVLLQQAHGVAQVTLSYPARFNAMTRAMWQSLRTVFEDLQQQPTVRCVLVQGDGAHFCAGGDISEYPDFRFDPERLRHFHEQEVWGALQAMLNCDVPLVAQIRGNCMGAGVEIASCCDIRLAADSARFGAPIAKLGFPMAPRESALVARELGLGVARRMLLEAAVFNAEDMQRCGFLSQVLPPDQLLVQAQNRAQHIAALAPHAARLNKQTLRAFCSSSPEAGTLLESQAYTYADSAEHREGITAFLEKRPPVF